jgi:hypothetical protein
MHLSFYYYAVLTTATLSYAAVNHNNDGCPVLTDPTLCGSSPSIMTPPDTCATGDFNFPPMPPCCRIQSETKPCQNPAPESGAVCVLFPPRTKFNNNTN